jgi:RNA polymerase sigma-70 factor (ECF subfamily)
MSPGLAPLLALAVALALRAGEGRADDPALAVRIRLGDPAAFRRFFDETHADLLRTVRRRGLPPDAAEDVVQQSYVWIWEHRAEIDADRPLRGLLFRIGLTRGLNALRDGARAAGVDAPVELAADLAPHADPAALAELRRALAVAVARLPARRREVFDLCFSDGLSHREAAEVLGLSPRTVEHQMAHALKALRAQLALFQT